MGNRAGTAFGRFGLKNTSCIGFAVEGGRDGGTASLKGPSFCLLDQGRTVGVGDVRSYHGSLNKDRSLSWGAGRHANWIAQGSALISSEAIAHAAVGF